MVSIFSFHFSYFDLFLFYIVAFCIGLAKTGVHGAGMVSVPLLAYIFGGRASSGILLPMLLIADLLGVTYYHQHASWKHLKVLFPWAAVGVIAGTIIGSIINDEIFRSIMAIIIVTSVIIMIWLERGGKEQVPHDKRFSASMGIAGGFTSMVGNLAGAVMAVYLLAMRLPKNVYIATTAWFFMITNWFKVPFHIFAWKTISPDIIFLDMTCIPAVGAGAYAGIILVEKIPERAYRWFIIATTLIASIFMLIRFQ